MGESSPRSNARRCALIASGMLLFGCGGDDSGTVGPAGTQVTLELDRLPVLDPTTEGHYRAWLLDASGLPHDAGPIDPGAMSTFESPIASATGLEITVEPPALAAGAPRQVILRGTFSRGVASLGVRGALTASGLALRERPGQFTMFTPSDNHANGYPSHEEAGVWLFNMAPRDTEQNDMWVRLTPLAPGWVYEGWMVRDIDRPTAIWLSYGKFLPDASGAVNRRDDTGWGPFSGVLDFQTAGEEEFPGDDWISNPLGYDWPSELPLPLDLREKDGNGALRWTHVITIEPAADRGERIRSERPFPLPLYRDPFGDDAPGRPRSITFHPDRVPSGTARVR